MPQNYRSQNGNVWFLIRLHLKVALPACRATLKNLLADGRGGWVADGRLFIIRVAAKFSFLCFAKIFSNFAKFKIILAKFCKTPNFDTIVLNFAKFKENFAKHENFAKFLRNYEYENFAATPVWSGVRGGADRCSLGASSMLTQIVPYSSSLYIVSILWSIILWPVLSANSIILFWQFCQ